jgi:glycosyltransferase involved in cell wall biosynthesis
MGCPVIISDRCGSYGPNDDVQEDKNGFVFPFGDIGAMASQIKKLIADPDKRGRFGEYSSNIAVQFQERAHGLVLNDLLTKITDGKRGN